MQARSAKGSHAPQSCSSLKTGHLWIQSWPQDGCREDERKWISLIYTHIIGQETTIHQEHQSSTTPAAQGLEKYLMTRIHHKTFAASALDRERDEALALRMAALDFVTARHLDIPPGLLDSDAPVQAMKELHKVNDYKVRLLRFFCVWFRSSWG